MKEGGRNFVAGQIVGVGYALPNNIWKSLLKFFTAQSSAADVVVT